jgi:outer membrane protein
MRRFALFIALAPVAALAQPRPAAPAPTPAPAPALRTLTLDEAVRTARARHPDIQNANAQTEEARARVDQARAPLLPQLTGRAVYQHIEQQNTSSGVVPGGTPTGTIAIGTNLWQASVGVTQLVWDFGQTTGRMHAAEHTLSAQDASGHAALRQVVLSVRTFYFAARADKALVQVARETLQNQLRHLDQVEAFVQVGTRAQIEAVSQRTAVASARLTLIRAENAYAAARSQLNQAMGTPGTTDFDVADDSLSPVAGEDGTLDAALQLAYAARPELRAFSEQRRSEEEIVTSTKGQYWPSVSLYGTASEAGDALDNLGWGLVGGVNLTWPLFQGGSTRAQVREAQWAEVAIDAQTESLRQSVRVEVESALLAVRGAKSEVDAAREALVNAREQLRLAEGRYQTGAGSIIELGDAQVAVTQAAAQTVQADFDVATARAQLLHALGRDS